MTDTLIIFDDDQNYDLDIDQIYNDFIKVIDEARSYVNISNPNNANILKNITKDTFTGSAANGIFQPETTPQESRCHAFYRIIGFPVVASDNRIYNPGFNIIVEEGLALNIEKKVSIANNPLKGFQKLSDFREKYINNFLKIFSNNTSVDAGVLCLSLHNFRSLSAPFDKNFDAIEDPFNESNQSYEIEDDSLVGANSFITFQDYIDINNRKPSKYTNKRYHIIKPFIVDPRIDLSTPTYKKIGVPFVKDDSQLKVDDIKSVKRPLIEKVIRDRFEENKISNTTVIKNVVNFLKNSNIIRDKKILDSLNNDFQSSSDSDQLYKYINIIRAMMTKLVDSYKTIKNIQSQYYWLPIPSTTGPEGGFSTHPVFPNLYYDGYKKIYETSYDFAIIVSQYRSLIDSVTAESAKLNGVPDPGAYSLGKFTTTFDNTTSSAFGDTNEQELDNKLKEREQDLNKAGKALREMEIILGEFSGFGFCDMIAIIGGLYLMPVYSVLGFLDPDAYKRARIHIKSLPEENPSDIKTALEDLTKYVKILYDIMEAMIQSYFNSAFKS